MKHYDITIKGHVQGVGFRYSARNMARHYGIKGFVRNEPDGSVYIEAEGEEENVQLYLQWCRKGPAMGRIDTFLVNEGPLRNFNDFDVRHF